MKFGIFSLPTYFPESDGSVNDFFRRVLDFLDESERLGFDVAWANEHHFHPYGGMIPFPPVLLATVAARTQRMRIGTSVALPPLYHPLQLAEAYAMLDQVSGGRLEFGVGRGFVRHDYETVGVPWDEAQERMVETIEVVLKAWQEQPFSHHGKYFHFDDVSVWPTPLQRPHPPVWGACTANPASFEWCGRSGFNLLTVIHLKPLEDLAALVRLYKDAAADAGHDVSKLRVSTHFQAYCSEDREEAVREASRAMIRYRDLNTDARLQTAATLYGRDHASPEALIEEGRACVGRPDECAAILARARDVVGLDEVDFTFYYGGMDYQKAKRSYELFAREVMPVVRGQTA